VRDRDGALCLLAESHARHAEGGRLFLDPSGIGEHHSRSVVERKHLEVAQGVDRLQSIQQLPEAKRFGIPACAWVDWKNDRHLPRDSGKALEDGGQGGGGIHVRGPVKCCRRKFARDYAQSLEHSERTCPRQVPEEGIDHHVSREDDSLLRDPFLQQIGTRVVGWRQQQVG
jgi:hypothetical protein